MLLEVAELINSRVGMKLSSLDHMEIDHRIAMCVVAGNVRRSARMSIKHWKDADIFDFIKCKSDDARVSHWTTNISVEIDNAFFRAFKKKDAHAVKLYKHCINAMHTSGEPGFCNMSLAQNGEVDVVVSTNPCGEIFLLPWENCNLGHVNLGMFYDNIEKAKHAFMMMTRFLIRATFGDIYSPWQKLVVMKNRRIGVGFFGFQDWLCKQGKKYSDCHNDVEVQQALRLFYRVVKKTAMEYSHQLRIPAPIKNTCIAPTGTIAKLPGASEGGQALLFPFYEQRIRHQKDDPKIPELMMQGVEFEECINKQEGVNTIIAKHVCKHPLVDEVAALGYDAEDIVEGQNEISVHDTLAIQAMLQREWADNAISLTVNLTPDTTEKELYHTIIKFLPKLKGTTVLVGAGGRPQPPYTEITREEYDAYEGRKIVMDTKGQCSGNSCPIK
jgi:adenosylcobalamin-dependent ribonucleoside-triphosphate reductase